MGQQRLWCLYASGLEQSLSVGQQALLCLRTRLSTSTVLRARQGSQFTQSECLCSDTHIAALHQGAGLGKIVVCRLKDRLSAQLWLQHDDVTALLGCVERLTQLQQLCIETHSEPHARRPRGVCVTWPAASPAYSALTASSALQELDVGYNSFPEGAWQHMFPPRRALRALQRFGSSGGSRTPTSLADVNRIASCCPGLEHIALYVGPGVQLTVLMQLSSLTELHLYLHSPFIYPPVKAVADTVQSVARLTQLRKLSVGTWDVTDRGVESLAAVRQTLLPLTELRGLTHVISRLQQRDPLADFEAQVRACRLQRLTPAWHAWPLQGQLELHRTAQ